LGILFKFVQFIWEALYTYAASEQGGQELRAILDEVEAAGIDIPFYEPSQEGQQGEAGIRGDVGVYGYTEEANDPNVSTHRKVYPPER
jgi:hypothetical protein